MDQRSPIEGRYRFGPFLLDPAERLVTRDGAAVALTTRLFELLLAFVRNPGRLVTKSDLMDAVWSDRVVDESSLTQAIFSLRKALGDDGRYITTVTGRGYSFGVAVENIGPAPRSDAGREALAPTSAPEATTARAAKSGWVYAGLAGGLAIFLASLAVFVWPRSIPQARKPLVVTVADFQNLSENPLFDRTFTTATISDLRQSPHLSILPESTVEETLDLMMRPKNTRLTPELAREVCARNNGQAVVSGTIAQFGANYLLTLTAADCVGGQVLSDQKAEVNSLDALLPALDRLVEGVRQRLGESAASIEQFNVPILKQRTASFEALRAYSEAFDEFDHGKYIESIPLFQRAIEIDPNFAAAYDGLSTAYSNTHENRLDIANITKAYELRDNASELERLHILMRYNFSVLGDYEEAIRILKSWTELYPDDASAWANLANDEVWLGEYSQAIQDGTRSLRLNPGMESAYVVLATAYVRSGRLDLASAICAQSVADHLDDFGTHRVLYDIAFLRRGRAAMQHELSWANGKPAERFMLMEAGQAEFSEGNVRDGLDTFARALAIGRSLGLGNYIAASLARSLYDLGEKDAARATLDQAPAGFDSGDFRFDLLEFGDETRGNILLNAALARSPSDTLLNRDFAPQARAVAALRHNEAAEAVKAMAPSAGLIETHTFDASYVHGEAYLAAGDAASAAREFHKIADSPALDPVSPLYSLAWLGVARAERQANQMAPSRAAYEKLFALWKNADPDLPALQDARREYGTCRPLDIPACKKLPGHGS